MQNAYGLLLLLCLLAAPALKAAESGWVSETVATGSQIDPASMAVDSSGQLHLLLTEMVPLGSSTVQHIRHVSKNAAGAWSSELLFPSAAPWLGYKEGSIAAHSDRLYVCYYQDKGSPSQASLNKRLELWSKNLTSGEASREIVDEGGAGGADPDVGKNCKIAVDNDGGIHIAYFDATNHKIKYAYRAGLLGTWEIYASAATLVGMGLVSHHDLVVDSSKKVHLAYLEWTNTSEVPTTDLKYRSKPSGQLYFSPSANIETSGETGSYPSMGIDPQGGVHIAYLRDNSFFRHAVLSSNGNLAINRITDQAVPQVVSLIAKVDGIDLFVSEFSSGQTRLKHYASALDGSNVTRETLALFDDGIDIMHSTPMLAAIDPSGKIHVVYIDPSGNVIYASKAPLSAAEEEETGGFSEPEGSPADAAGGPVDEEGSAVIPPDAGPVEIDRGIAGDGVEEGGGIVGPEIGGEETDPDPIVDDLPKPKGNKGSGGCSLRKD